MQHQPMLLPPDALVRVIDQLVDHIDRDLLDRLYPGGGGGAPAYDPV